MKPSLPTPSLAVRMCFCGADVSAGGAREAHRARAEAKWVAAGRHPDDRCLCRPCAQHSWDEHEAADAAEAHHEEQLARDAQRIADLIRIELGEPLLLGVTAATGAVERVVADLRQRNPVVVRDIGLTREVGVKDLMMAKGITRSTAYRWLRVITGRKNGTGRTLRAPLAQVEAYVAAGCPPVWSRATGRAAR